MILNSKILNFELTKSIINLVEKIKKDNKNFWNKE
jgi:hypothetical protein